MRDLAARERDIRGLERPGKGRDGDEVERQRGELAGEQLGLLDPLLREPAVERRVAVHDLVDVEERLPCRATRKSLDRRRLVELASN